MGASANRPEARLSFPSRHAVVRTICSVAVTAIVILIADCSSADGPIAAPGLSNSIVFISNRSGADEIYVMDPDGSHVRELPSVPGIKAFPVVSPDGRKIVFTLGPTFGPGQASLFVVNSDSNGLAQLTTDSAQDNFASWSPDSRHIVFTSTRDGNEEVYRMDADGSNQKRLTDAPGYDYEPSWSPDGRSILFVSDRDSTSGPNNEIYSMPAAGGPAHPVTIGYAPEWSPSGSRFLFKRDDNIYVSLTPDGSSVRQLTSDAVAQFQVRWSPDERTLAYSHDVENNYSIWLVNADGSNERQLALTFEGASDFEPSWTRH